MTRGSLRKRALFLGACFMACVVALWPPYDRHGEPGRIKLGLDLQGGAHLVLQVMTDGAPTKELLSETMRVLERRANQFGVADPVITEYGRSGDQILVQLPGVKDVAQAKRELVSVAQLSLHVVHDVAPSRELLKTRLAGTVPETLEVVEGEENGQPAFHLVSRQAAITGRDLKTARVGVGEQGEPNVEFSLKPPGAERFHQATTRNVGRSLAIVLDERVISAPIIEQPIGAEGQIRGRFTAAEADELARLLRAGALPAKLRYVHELTVGASLGRDSIRAGIVASLAALLFIASFMVVYYRLAGLNAVMALLANLVILLAALAVSEASLTLPGIAGIILTVGVGVDTNVLVFERIREELRHGQTVHAAVRNGFDRVWVAILDTHATALIAAAFLFQFGTGALKGFAVTLVLGLVANVCASYFGSRFLFEWLLSRRKAATLSI
jgi:preprotein translocase subunit SecD